MRIEPAESQADRDPLEPLSLSPRTTQAMSSSQNGMV